MQPHYSILSGSRDRVAGHVIHRSDYKVPDYLVDSLHLQFELGESDTHVKSKIALRVNPASASPAKDLQLHGDSLELLSIDLNGQRLSANQYQIADNRLTIYSVPKAFTLDIENRIKPRENTLLRGLYQSHGNFCTQCEAEGFRRITYFLDRPDVMTHYTTTIIADEKRYPMLLSNGNLIRSEKLPEGKHCACWEDPFKKPCYLFALVAGDFDLVEDTFVTLSGRHVALRIYVEKGYRDQCAHAMHALKKAMKWDEEAFGREYDLNNYMIVAVSDFNMGAMENKGLNIFNTKYILAKSDTATDQDFIHIESVIAHEYCHNWSGNRVTCRDWFQLSLKEGFTIFRDQTFTADTTSKTVARIQDVRDLRATQFPEDAGPLAHSVRPDSYMEIDNFYTATIYNKGAEVIRMMQTILGNALFRKGVDLYFSRHDGQAVTIEDFVKAMEEASQLDLTQFRLWYSQAGTPTIEVDDHYDAEKKCYTLKIKQTCPDTPGQTNKKPMHIPIPFGLLNKKGEEIFSDLIQLKKQEEEFVFENIAEKPIPSLLRHFSAPVKLQYPYTNDKLALLFQHDSDEFNRWEAGQQYAVNTALELIYAHNEKKSLSVSPNFIAAFENVLIHSEKDPYFYSELITLPSKYYMAEQLPAIDVDGIQAAYEFLIKTMAMQLKNTLLHCYEKYRHEKNNHFDIQIAGKRQLKNRCLSYLLQLPENNTLGMTQFQSSLGHNMTDTLIALEGLVDSESEAREEALALFYKTFQHDALVLDKWFAIQATSKMGTVAHIKKLLQHPSFDIKNPNKVYALIGAFGQRNFSEFHALSGEGYVLLADIVLQLDTFNPNVAARMIKPLTQWKRYLGVRQKMMHEQIERIAKEKTISKDIFELVNKSL